MVADGHRMRSLATLQTTVALCSGLLTSCMGDSKQHLLDELKSRGLSDGLVLGGAAGHGYVQYRLPGVGSLLYGLGKSVQIAGISPDGHVAFGRTKTSGQIWLLSLADGSLLGEVMLRELSGQPSIALSWDRARIAICGKFESFAGGAAFGVKILQASDGSEQHSFPLPLGFGADGCGQLTWHPDGDTLLMDSEGVILNIRLRFGRIEPVIRGSLPSWAPNGQSFCLRTEAGTLGICSADFRIMKQSVAGSNVRTFTRWSPDGEYVAFVDQTFTASQLSVWRNHDGESASLGMIVKGGSVSTGWLYLKPDVVRRSSQRL